jgi:hypothetical protein
MPAVRQMRRIIVLVHVVMFKLKEPSAENIGEVVSRLLPLADEVPMVRSLEAGVDVVKSARSYDVDFEE